jgi:protocatechuate 4,5-dioxygenase alpha subunit
MDIPGTYVFDLERSEQGYALNQMGYALQRAENRELFVADERAFMEGYGVTPDQIDAVVARDWLRLIRLGANSYILMKIGATLGIGHYHQGAQERGETYEEFLATRNVPGAT